MENSCLLSKDQHHNKRINIFFVKEDKIFMAKYIDPDEYMDHKTDSWDDEIDDDSSSRYFHDTRENWNPHPPQHTRPPQKSDRTNAFLTIQGYPYILNDYLENTIFKQIDQALITNSLSISNSGPGRTIVDFSIDDTKPIFGNKIKYQRFMEAIFKNVCGHQSNILPVLQKKIIVQIDYQLENQRTGQLLKSATEKLEIRKRDYFMDVNVRSVNDNSLDNSILTNFSDSLTTSITEFLHGSETMLCRITGISLFYPAIISPHHHSHLLRHSTHTTPHAHHPNSKNVHVPNPHLNGPVHKNYLHPEKDCHTHQYNNLYHYDNNYSDIHFHHAEIEDKPNHIVLIPVGSWKFNQVFRVATGHKIVFKYSIWKSDIIMVKNTRGIAELLGGAPHRKVHKTIEDILDRLIDLKQSNYDQDLKLENVLRILDNRMSEDQASELTNNIITSYNSNSTGN